MVTRSPEGGDKPSNPGLSDFKVLPEQRGVSPRVQKLESPRLPEVNKPGEQLWRPISPRDREKIETFINDLVQNKEEVLDQLQSYLHKPNKSRDELALAIYLDTVVKRDVLGINPFASKEPGDEAHQESREYIAILAAEHIAKTWLKEHPDSELASIITDATIDAPDFIQQAFLYEMWSSIRSKMATEE